MSEEVLIQYLKLSGKELLDRESATRHERMIQRLPALQVSCSRDVICDDMEGRLQFRSENFKSTLLCVLIHSAGQEQSPSCLTINQVGSKLQQK